MKKYTYHVFMHSRVLESHVAAEAGPLVAKAAELNEKKIRGFKNFFSIIDFDTSVRKRERRSKISQTEERESDKRREKE